MNAKASVRWLTLLLSAALAAACVTTGEPRYYLMSPVAPSQPPGAAPELVVGVGPLNLADYLQRANIVTRESSSRVHVAPEHKWGAALDSHLAELLAEDLRMRLGLAGVHVYPWNPGVRLDYQLVADITRFIHQDSAVHLDARWQLIDRGGGKSRSGFTRITEPAAADYDEIVDAMSRAVGRLADDVATRLLQPAGGR